jgi:hypothetical protein
VPAANDNGDPVLLLDGAAYLSMITFMIKKMILKMIIFSRTARTRSAEIAPRGDADLAGVPDHRPPSRHSSAKGVGDGSVISLRAPDTTAQS